MPYREEMTWVETHKRWQRMHQGIRYRVRCIELDQDRTLPRVHDFSRDGSRAAANAWWERKLAELLGKPARVQTLTRMMSEEDELRQRVAQLEREAFEARKHLQARDDRLNHILVNLPVKMNKDGTGDIDEGEIARDPEVDRLEQMTQAGLPAGTGPANRTLRAVCGGWLSLIKGEMKAVSFTEIRDFTGALCAKHGDAFDVAELTEDAVEATYVWLRDSGKSDGWRKKRLGFFKRLVRYAWEKRLCEMPRNLDSFSFEVRAKKVETYDLAAVRAVLAKIKPRFRLYALLGCNAGMTNSDIGRLTADMVDLQKGRLVRRRGKTEAHANVPTVDYALWQETARLLAECKADHPTLWLTSSDNTPLWTQEVREGTDTAKKDLLVLQWRRAKIRPALKAFRSIAATTLKSHPTYSRFVEHFLGHAPRGVAEKHYAGDDASWQAGFDEALAWLRTQLLGAK